MVLKSSLFQPTTVADEARLIDFLARVFSVSTRAPFLDPALLRWKYWIPRADYTEPRSFVLERNGAIASHVGVWPISIETGEPRVQGAHMIDWASDPKAPGSGTALLQHLVRQFDFIYSIGGSSITQRILPAFGFQQVTENWMGARPLRPLRQMIFHQAKNWKLPLRLARNTWWSAIPGPHEKNGWTAIETPVKDFEAPIPCARNRAFFRYLEQCPAIQLHLYRLVANNNEEGWLALGLVHKQARIVGIWLRTTSPTRLRSAYLAARDASARLDMAFEVSAAGSAGLSETAAIEAGFRIMRHTPVYLLQKNRVPLMPFEFQLADNDEFFLNAGAPEFLS